MRAWIGVALLTSLVVSGAPLTAQTALEDFQCGDEGHEDELWIDCFTRYTTALKQGANGLRKAEETADAAQPKGVRLAKAQAQDDLTTDVASDDSTTKRDFLSMLLTSLASDNFEDSDGELRLAYNFGPDAFGGKGIAGLSFEAVAKDPQVFDQLLEQIPEDLRASQKGSLEGELEDFDDLETRLHISFLGGLGGTSWGQRPVTEYSTRLFESVVENLNHEIDARETEALREVASLQTSPETPSLGSKVSDTDPRVAAAVEAVLLAAGKAIVERHQALARLLKETNFYRLGDLVANQPQLYLTLSARNRDDLVGPDEKSAKLSYEFGTGNFNGLNRKCKGKPAGQATLDCYSDFLTDNKDLLRKPLRLKLEAEYMEVDPYSFSVDLSGGMNGEGEGGEGGEMAATTASLELDKVEKLVAALTIGKALKLEDSDAKDDPTVLTRFDFQSKYEDVSNDPMRQDRWVSTLTLSQRVSEESSLAVSLIYANKPEFRGMVDEEFSARAGLKFEVDRATKPKK